MTLTIPTKDIVYRTRHGLQVAADSREILSLLPSDCVDLILTSPPFALLRQKSYGNHEQEPYVAWLGEFGAAAFRVLKETGSLVLDLGGAYQRGRPVRSLYNFRVLLDFCDRVGFRLAEEFFWHNPAKLPSPIEWVNKRKIRAKDSVNTVWWFSKGDYPKADVTKVLVPYSDRMKTLLKDPQKFYSPKNRPSGHDIAAAFGKQNAGAIPSNLLRIPNTESNSHYLRACKLLGEEGHPARFPAELPRFFIKFLTDPGDLLIDIFSGSNTTGEVAEELARKWISIELDRSYACLSGVRFMQGWSDESIRHGFQELQRGEVLTLHGDRPARVPAARSTRVRQRLGQRNLFQG
jgi:site-specific DNA-methyltransferase (cytosine-N4-specific)